MGIEKFFPNESPVDIIFDPVPSYSGDWLFTVPNLLKNAKVVDKKNLFQEFYQKTYQKPLENIFQTPRILDLQVGFISRPNSDNLGRCLRYSKVDFFLELTSYLDQNIDNYKLSNEERSKRLRSLISNLKKDNETLNIAYSEALKEKVRKINDTLVNGVSSEYYEALLQDYAPYEKKISFEEYLKASYGITSKFQMGMLRLNDFFDQNIDFHKLYNCFDSDIFCLLFAKIIYENNLIREQETGHLDNSYGYLFQYMDALNKMISENKKYDPKILYQKEKSRRYSRYQFQQDFKELMGRHPEAKQIKLPDLGNDDIEKYKDISLMEKISLLYSDDVKVNWEFLKEGEKIKKGGSESKKTSTTPIKKDINELVRETNLRIGILEDSGFIGRPVKGLNTFNGYYAFIYASGVVILEKFWNNESELTPAVGNATYVMNIDNFIELSKLSKTDLIEYMKTLPEIGVKRIFHTTINNWQKNLYKEINGSYRLEDAIEFINGLKGGRTNEQ